MNEGARQANEEAHRRSLRDANESQNAKLNRIIELLEKLVAVEHARALDSATYERDGLLFCKNCGTGMGAVEDEPPSQ